MHSPPLSTVESCPTSEQQRWCYSLLCPSSVLTIPPKCEKLTKSMIFLGWVVKVKNFQSHHTGRNTTRVLLRHVPELSFDCSDQMWKMDKIDDFRGFCCHGEKFQSPHTTYHLKSISSLFIRWFPQLFCVCRTFPHRPATLNLILQLGFCVVGTECVLMESGVG